MTKHADARVAQVRQFNRFYTRQIGALNREFLDSEFSLTDVRVLYELRHHDRLTASVLGQTLALDAAYLSRILREFERKGLLVKSPSKADRRETHLRLSATGRKVFDAIEARQQVAVADMLRALAGDEQRHIVESMQRIERLLDRAGPTEPSYTLREPRPGDIGWIVHRHGALYHEEYDWDEQFEVLVAEIAADFAKHHDPRRERCWVAEYQGEIVGSIFCVEKSKTVAKLRLLYVEPSARHLGIGTRLVDECIRFARKAGYRKMTLWTQSLLSAARRVYERAGFKLVHEESHHSFGADLVAQTWEMRL
ncbi:MAG TPA: bifunctional helix-turn-helix transcriptional regulator/GNAT family N-acetyltransferase [Gemmatimonadaceae bacterium]|nr:bifunctional helix-turn-helix transcriptional regulator/GNAT family N-acetyltransferase [Gemmatimonadaceae bacterium]